MSARIAILGGGPAGSATALGLLAEGVDPGDVVIVDRARFPRPKLCGGALTARGTEALVALVGRPDHGASTRGLVFRSALGEIEVRERGDQWLYDRAHLDALLLARCTEAGIAVRQQTRVTGLEPDRDGWVVKTARARERFAWVIGADGARGVSRRASGMPGGIVGRLVEGVYEPVDEPPPDDRLYFDFDPIIDGIPGYAWLFPYPKPGTRGLWKIGVMDGRGRVGGAALRAWTEALARRHGFRRVDDKIAGWPEHYYDHRVGAHRPGLILVGEAHGIDPLLGEGIAPALYMARYAARRLREALDRGESFVRGYERGFARTDEGRNLWFQARLANRLYGPRPNRWLRVLFDNAHLRRLAGSGEEAYGRLARRIPSLCLSYAGQVIAGGRLPSNAAITR